VATVAWTTEQMMRQLLPGDPEQLWSDETGAVVLHRVNLDRSWYGHRAEDLTYGLPTRVAMIYREGGVIVPTADSVLQEGDDPVLLTAKESVEDVNQHCADKAVNPE
jgi:trk system potassium uptake protein TrkA